MRKTLLNKYKLSNKVINRFEMIMEGMTYMEIGEIQGINYKHIRTAMCKVRKKFKAKNNSELIKILCNITHKEEENRIRTEYEYRIKQLYKLNVELIDKIKELNTQVKCNGLPVGTNTAL